ncbi:MAG TPA: glucose 1-dehydrogenase [Sporichthyaceae bacterium]|jgi:NAD(P)-dependent dehydrogenase (short-subunit alcohol dehydrogenase family)|nr:glucose 1-dehydrogenase [Sporichthyaceae bacterium]
MRPVYVLGVAAHPWGKFADKSQLQLAVETLSAAISDAGLHRRDLQGLVAASSRFEGGMGWGLHANEVLQTISENGAAAVNVGGGCAAGGIAVHTAATMIAAGQVEVVAALGAEKMPKGFIPRPPGCPDDITDSDYLRWVAIGATNPAYWAIEARRRMHEHGTTVETLAAATVLMRRHGSANPRARYRTPTDVAEVLTSPMVADPLHLLQICAVSDGAAAVVLGSAEAARRVGGPLIQVAGSAVATGQFGDPSVRIPTVSRNVVGSPVPHTSEVAGAVTGALAAAGLGTGDVDVLETADNTAWHLLAWPENFGFLEPGQADWMLERGEFGIEGKLPLNPSGGFLSFGEATTGGSSAIGRAIAVQFAAAGACMVVADVRAEPREGGAPTHELIRSAGGSAVFVPTDVTVVAELQHMVAEAERLGGVDILVNNAGLLRAARLIDMTESDYDAVLDVNLRGVFFAAQAAARAMIAADRPGVIVNLSSIGGLQGVPGISAYCAAKGAVRLLTYSLAKELGPRGIRVCALHPGVIDTSMTRVDVPVPRGADGPAGRDVPLRRLGTPEDVAKAAVFLASDEAAFVTGASLTVDGGQLCMG